MLNEIVGKMSPRTKQLLLIGFAIGAVFGILLTVLAAGRAMDQRQEELRTENEELTKENAILRNHAAENEETTSSAEVLASDENGWSLVLVNESHPLDTTYAPAELTELEPERAVDSRIAEDAQAMLDAALADGLSVYVGSAYRSYEQQREVFNSTMQDWIDQGYTPFEAYEETRKSVAIPGTSEHATGLALDIISTEYEELDEEHANTPEAQWLEEHSWEYGFILRFPPDKADVTGIIYEPWHYRYVGREAAEEIKNAQITLEEYLEQE